MFVWQFNDGLGWRGGEGEKFPSVEAAAERAKQHWGRWPHDHLRVMGQAPEGRSSTTGYLMYWWQDGSTAEERIAENGI